MSDIIVKEIPPLTEETIKRLSDARDYPIIYDDDSPETTPGMHEAFLRSRLENPLS